MTANKLGILKSTGLYSLGMIFLRASSFLLLPFYSQVFTTSEFGNYTLIISFYTIIAVVVQAGFQTALTKYYIEAESSNEKKLVFSTIINSLSLLAVLVSLLLIIFSGQTSQLILTTGAYSPIIISASFLLILETMAFYNLHLLRTREESKKYVLIVSISAIINLLFNFIFISSVKFGILGIFLAQIVSSAVSVGLSFLFIKNEYQLTINPRILRKLLIFSLPLLAAGILSTFVDLADRFLINHYMSTEDVGSYSLAYRIAMVMNIVVISFSSVWSPRSLDDIKQKQISKTMPGVFTKLCFMLYLVFLTISLFTNDLFTFRFFGKTLFASEYYSGVIIIPFILISYFFRGISSFYSIYPLTTGKSYHFLLGDVIGFVSNILLNIYLIPRYGLIGAAIATLASYFFIALYSFAISYKTLSFKYEKGKLFFLSFTTITFYIISSFAGNLALDIVLIVTFLIFGYLVLHERKLSFDFIEK